MQGLSPATLTHQARVVAPPPASGLPCWFSYRDGEGKKIRAEHAEESLRERTDAIGLALWECWCGYRQNRFSLPAARRTIVVGPSPSIVAVLNATPDSFFKGSRSLDAPSAIERGLRLLDQGADWLDIGGESTRPGAEEIPGEEELRRVLPVIEGLRRRTEAPISIDTRKASVAKQALEAGADIINDVSGMQFDPGMAQVAAQMRAPIVLNHMRGTPQDMHSFAHYDDPVEETIEELRLCVNRGLRAGIDSSRILLDPGIGFAKRPEDNLEILRRLHEFRSLGAPLFVGVSRKSFVGKLLDERPPEGRLWGSAAAVAAAVFGGAKMIRVHDPAEMADVVKVAAAIAEGKA